jgi:lipid-binding SYLF domain-containing protein
MWSLIENEDGTKTITCDNRVIGIYGETNGRWAGIKLDGSMVWGDSELEVYNKLTGLL